MASNAVSIREKPLEFVVSLAEKHSLVLSPAGEGRGARPLLLGFPACSMDRGFQDPGRHLHVEIIIGGKIFISTTVAVPLECSELPCGEGGARGIPVGTDRIG